MKKTAQNLKLSNKQLEKAAIPTHQQKTLKGGNGNDPVPPPEDDELIGTDDHMDG